MPLLEINEIFCGRWMLWSCLFAMHVHKNIFHHLMLEIALAMAASNDEKYELSIQELI